MTKQGEENREYNYGRANKDKAGRAIGLLFIFIALYLVMYLFTYISVESEHFTQTAPKRIGLIFELLGGLLPLGGLLSLEQRKINAKRDDYYIIIGFMYIFCGKIVENVSMPIGPIMALVVVVFSFFLHKLANPKYSCSFAAILAILWGIEFWNKL